MSNEQQRWVKILPSAVESGYDWSDYVGRIFELYKHSEGLFWLKLATGNYQIEPNHVQEVYVYDEPMEMRDAEEQPTEKNINKYDKAFEDLNQNSDKPMRVRVVKAGSMLAWYFNMCGEEFDVLAEEGEFFKVGGKRYIRKRDCEVVTKPFCRNHHNGTDRIAELENRVAQLEEQHEVTHRLAAQAVLGMSDHAEPQRDHVKAESNLERAKRLYPTGTRFKSILTEVDRVSNGDFIESEGGTCIRISACGCVFYNGKWAEIVQDEPAVSLTAEQAEVLQQTFEKQLKSEPTLPGRDKPLVNH